MKVVNAEEMRNIDNKTINEIGIPGVVLMENAGQGASRIIDYICDTEDVSSISIFVGKGNNGGDGLVIGRYLDILDYDVKIYLLAEPEDFSGDALINLKVAENMSLPMELLTSEKHLESHKDDINKSHLLIDSIFGTGLKGPVRGFAGKLIDFLNSTGLPIIAVDLPSGLEADTGRAEGPCINAKLTATMALPKLGLLLYPGVNYTGELEIVDIGVPPSVIESQNTMTNLVEYEDVKNLLPERPGDAHKGTFGRIFILAGSEGFTGAAALTTNAALRIGSGLVILGIPASINDIMEIKLTEAMTLPLPETESRTLARESMEQIMEMVEKSDAVAIGPGLSRNESTVELIQELCTKINIPKVIDADGLNAISDHKSILKELGENTVLTPHPGEMARLMGCSVDNIQQDRINTARNFAVENNLVVVLKGAPTVIANSSGEVYINSTGNPGLASGGTGDVLTGIIAGYIGQGLSPENSAILGVYIHGMAGDLTAGRYDESGMLAGDLLMAIPLAVRNLTQLVFID
ncbi:NAD(P)H-hydrate dehydratase [Candidatus Poribacteria bacterium]|nr:NAD(P)H-hydrate dehydratase [Candidatus Poribacteria bacterium]